MALDAPHNIRDLIKGHVNGQILSESVTRLTAPGENYGSLMLKVDFTVKTENKEEVVYTVAKCVPPNEEIQKIFNIPITFKNEIGWYDNVIPTIIEFQKEHGVKNVADFFMKIYGSRLSLDPSSQEVDDDGIILMENLAVQGYVNAERRVGFDLEQSKVILKKLATFHAVPLALKLQKPTVFDQNIKKYLHKVIPADEKGLANALKPVISLLENLPEFSALVPKIRRIFEEVGPQGRNTKASEPWATCVHNDFWVNNMMIKENQAEDLKVIILDLQTCIYGSPVEDLLFFLGTSVQTHLAEKHFDELIKLYYMELMENLKLLNADTTLFPFGNFQEELKRQAPGQYAHCMFFIAIIFAEKEKSSDTTKKDFNPANELQKMFNNITDKHKEKYSFITREFSKRNWI